MSELELCGVDTEEEPVEELGHLLPALARLRTEEIAQVRRVFAAIDADGDGALDACELVESGLMASPDGSTGLDGGGDAQTLSELVCALMEQVEEEEGLRRARHLSGARALSVEAPPRAFLTVARSPFLISCVPLRTALPTSWSAR